MPIYEYQCENCGDLFEVMQKFSDQPLTRHDKCGGGPVRRLLSAPALQFKGSGWYITDYAKGSNSGSSSGKSEKKEGSTTSTSNSGSETSSSSPAPASSSTDSKSST